MADRAARRVLEAWIDRLRPAEERVQRARWDAASEATPKRRALVEFEATTFEACLHDDLGWAKLEQSLAERIDDPLLRRALEVLRLRLLPHTKPRPEALVKLEAEVEERFALTRADVGGERLDANAVGKVLRTSTDAVHCEAVWRAAVRVGEDVAPAVREMARLRNAHARALGYPDHRELSLVAQEVAPPALAAFLRELEEGTNEAWAEAKAALDARRARRFGVSPDALAPWHLGDVFLQMPPSEEGAPDALEDADPVTLTRATFEAIGFDVGPVLEKSDLEPREGKSPHAFCTHLDRKGDVRILANIEPGVRWTRTLLHEMGHAMYDRHLDFDLPWNLVRPPHASVTEGVAMLFGRLPEDETWRREVAGVEPDPAAAERRRRGLLTFVRWGLLMCRFEEGLYADPERDLDALWWDLTERLQGTRRPDPPARDVWAAKIHVACWPVYYHSYLLGECVASQLQHHIERVVFGRRLVGNPAAGAFLRERVFRPSAAPRWERLIEEAAGGPLRAKALLADLETGARERA
ncbi:MAG: hypothetical protein ACC662_04740 [Planctomycetota bacterium]